MNLSIVIDELVVPRGCSTVDLHNDIAIRGHLPHDACRLFESSSVHETIATNVANASQSQNT